MNRKSKRKFSPLWLLPIFIVLAIGVYNLPPVYSRLSWRVDVLKARIKNTLNPPEEIVFVPTAQAAPTLAVTLPPTPTLLPTQTATPVGPTLVPTPTATPLPEKVDLNGIKYYTTQCNRWNYCGPSNLAMALNFWGWSGNRDDVAKVIKPGVNDPKLDFIQRGRTDLNVMPYEMVDFVNDDTEYRSLSRNGGTVDLLKRLLAGGFPIIIEKGYYQRDTAGAYTWMGHYAFVTGYDDAQQSFTWQDVYVPLELCEGDTKKVGGNRQVTYDEFVTGWRAFNYLFVVVYPSDKENDVVRLLGDWNDSAWANQQALNLAEQDIQSVEGMDLYFAWFNKGSSLVQLLQYGDASSAYDYAFSLYPNIAEDKRPWRMLWYQTGPYWAYYYSGRYADVIGLANITLKTPSTGPTLEESLYWRGLAEFALGDSNAAFADMRETIRLNPNFTAGIFKLQEWGVSP